MQPRVIQLLLDINALFYQTFAGSFSATRGRIQPGVARVIAEWVQLSARQKLLDLGCGNGELARVLLEQGFDGLYLGVDGSAALVAEGRKRASPLSINRHLIHLAREMRANPTDTKNLLWQSLRNNQLGAHIYRQRPIDRFIADFYCPTANLVIEVDGPVHQYAREEDALRTDFLESLDLTVLRFSSEQVSMHLGNVVETIAQALTSRHALFFHANLATDFTALLPAARFDLAFAFATLHHLPSRRLRLDVLARVRERLAPGGRFIHSEWQFLNSPKLAARVQPWERVGLSAADVEPGDYLLDWRANDNSAGDVPALRYVHHFSTEELAELAAEAGFSIRHSFHSDGAGGRLGLYQVWQPL